MCVLQYREFPASWPADVCLDGLTVTFRQCGKTHVFDVEEKGNRDGRHFVCTPAGGGVVADCLIHDNGKDHFCTCEVSQNFGSCLHIEGILQLMIAGMMDDVMDARQVEPWPSPEQVDFESGVEDPFGMVLA